MSRKFEKNREVDSRYLNVPVKYILNYTGANEDGKDKEAKDKTLCIIDFYGNDKALVGWRNNKTCKIGMTKIYPVVKKGSKYYLNYKDNLILISNVGGWVIYGSSK